MNRDRGPGRMIMRGAALCIVSSFLAGCMASTAAGVVSRSAKTTAKAAGMAARMTLDGARMVSKPFRGKQEPAAPAK